MTKKQTLIILLIVVIVIIAVLVGARYFKLKQNKTMHDYVTNVLGYANMKHLIGSQNDVSGAGTTLALAIENVTPWNELALSENFKKKYANGKEILAERDNYTSYFVGSDKIDGEDIIVLFADEKKPVINLSNNSPITYEYYFKFKIDANNMLTDVELLKKLITNATTGEIIE